MSEIAKADLVELSGKIDLVNSNISHLINEIKTMRQQVEKHEERLDKAELSIHLQEPYKDIVTSISRSAIFNLIANVGVNAAIIGVALWIVGRK